MTDIPYTPLCALAEKYGTDKRPEPLGHGYTHYYHSLLGPQREMVHKVLEIGIDYGRSLFMWQEYFPNARIYGLDKDPARLITGDRIESHLCDQNDLESLRSVPSKVGRDFDLILDDGSHDPAHQIMTAKLLVPLLFLGGIYIIEDVPYPEQIIPYIPYPSTPVVFAPRDINSKLVVIHAA